MLALAVAAAFLVERNARNDRRAELLGVAERIERRIETQIGLLSTVRALVVANDFELDRRVMRTFIDRAAGETLVGGMQGIGIALYQPAGEGEGAQAIIRSAYGLDSEVWPETDQPHAFPIVILEPPDERNRAALGYDMYAEPVRREAMDQAWQTGDAAATSRVELVQEITSDRQPGFLVYLPVFDRGGAIHSMVYAPYRMGDLMRYALTQPTDLGVVARVWDGPATDAPMLEPDGGFDGGFERFVINVADRAWTIDLAMAAERGLARALSVLILLGGGAMALMAQRLIHLQAQRAELQKTAAEEAKRTAELRGLLLEETRHRLKNSIARIGSIARLTAREAASVAGFLQVFERHLQALGSAQDLLARTPDGRVDLQALVESELATAGVAPENVDYGGDSVELPPEVAQAAGLVLHELLTNSLKYGALTKPDGHLSVIWTTRSETTSIIWTERGAPFADAAEGFGSRLIATLITRQLAGTMEREALEDGFRLSLAWPNAS